MAIPRLLVVDDDTETRGMLTHFMQENGFFTTQCESEAEIRAHLASERVDLIVLDVMLGKENGVDICTRLRKEYDVPIILLSALSADHHRMAGYEGGADDYVAKPFNPDLLLAQVRAVLQRVQRSASLVYRRSISTFHFAGWSYDGKRDELTSPQGYQVALSRKETGLLKVFLANPHIPLTRNEIAPALDVTRPGGDADTESSGRAIDVLVGRLRNKLKDDPKNPELLRTERGTGYVFSCDVEVRESA